MQHMLDLIIGPSYEDVYSIRRVLLADRSEHQVLFLVKFSVSNKAVLSKLGIGYIHLPVGVFSHLPSHSQLYHSDQEPKTVELHYE
jgi:hypothetical protein